MFSQIPIINQSLMKREPRLGCATVECSENSNFNLCRGFCVHPCPFDQLTTTSDWISFSQALQIPFVYIVEWWIPHPFASQISLVLWYMHYAERPHASIKVSICNLELVRITSCNSVQHHSTSKPSTLMPAGFFGKFELITAFRNFNNNSFKLLLVFQGKWLAGNAFR